MSSTSRKRARARQERRRPPRVQTRAAAPRRAHHPRPPLPAALAGHPPRRLYAYALAAGLAAGALLIAASLVSARSTTDEPPPPAATFVAGIGGTAEMLAGVSQRGNTLGSPTAPVQLIEYTELQCPFCARFSTEILPILVRDYVRTGKLAVVFRGLAFIGPGSETALRTAAAAAAQNRLWNVTELLFANQGPENGWITDELLRSVVTAAGADAERAFAERDGVTAGRQIDDWARQAKADGVTGTPTFFVGRRGEAPEPMSPEAMTLTEFRRVLDGLLRR